MNMDGFLDSGNHLERELTAEPIAGPAAGAVGLHLLVAAMLIGYGWMLGLFHHNLWGSPGAGGAMQVSLTSALPLPADELNQNVLATETPSQAPATPSPKDQRRVDETAIPIMGKKLKPQKLNTPKTQQHQPPQPQNRAQYGEQSGSNMQRQMQPGTVIGQTTVGDNNFASLYGWYVDQINKKMEQSWNKYDVDPRTPKGTRAYIVFTIRRDGSVSNIQIDQASSSSTLNTSCMRAAQRVDTFGSLPPQYNQSTLKVSFYCEY
jgi:periplasmic protein TonB